MSNLNHDQRAIHFETWEHIHEVRILLTTVQAELGVRALDHDQSKLRPPEAGIFAEFTPKLRGTTYGSDEYRDNLKDMGPAIRHHQANNRHHPEFHDGEINGMTLIDLIEMLCDWMAATKRHEDGDIMRSIQINKDRFGMSDQLVSILENTVRTIPTTAEEE